MRRDRFEQIIRIIHFVDPHQEDNASLSKLPTFSQSLLDTFKQIIPQASMLQCRNMFHYGKDASVFACTFQARGGDHVKISMFCETSTGYLYNFTIYTGVDTSYETSTIIHYQNRLMITQTPPKLFFLS